MFIDGFVGQLIGTLVAWMAAVPFHPVPLYAMAMRLFMKRFPQFGIFDRLLGRRFPAAFDPVMNPLGNALADVLRVCP